MTLKHTSQMSMSVLLACAGARCLREACGPGLAATPPLGRGQEKAGGAAFQEVKKMIEDYKGQ